MYMNAKNISKNEKRKRAFALQTLCVALKIGFLNDSRSVWSAKVLFRFHCGVTRVLNK